MKLAAICVLTALRFAYGQQDGTIALFRDGESSPSYTSGLVEVYYDGSWEGICSGDTFGQNEADVICHQLGYTDADTWAVTDGKYGTVDSATYSDVNCGTNNDYQVLFQCDYEREGCNRDMAITVTCLNTRIEKEEYHGQVRLRGGSYTNEGIVEVYCNDEYGSVCYNDFGNTAADVVCNQLGYNNFANTSSVSRNQSQPVWLNDVSSCIFTTCLTTCQSCPVSDNSRSCTGNEVVYIQCSYDPELDDNTRTVGACDFTELAEAIAALIAIIAIMIIVCCVVCIFLAALPFCICCCLGVGIGAAASKA